MQFDSRTDGGMLGTKPGAKLPRPAASGTGATSRKNKLQRCSVCGQPGHKSRTCDLAHHQVEDAAARRAAADHPAVDPHAVLAASGLLALAAAPLHHGLVSSALPTPNTPPRLLPLEQWQPLSPRLVST